MLRACARSAEMLGGLVVKTPACRHAEPDDLYPVTRVPKAEPTPGSAEMSAPAHGRSAKSSVVAM